MLPRYFSTHLYDRSPFAYIEAGITMTSGMSMKCLSPLNYEIMRKCTKKYNSRAMRPHGKCISYRRYGSTVLTPVDGEKALKFTARRGAGDRIPIALKQSLTCLLFACKFIYCVYINSALHIVMISSSYHFIE